jgi:hypothetical protein
MYHRAHGIQDSSAGYFFPQISPTLIRLRVPDESAADPINYTPQKSKDIRMLNYTNLALSFTTQNSLVYHCRRLGYLADRSDYAGIVQNCWTVHSRFPSAQIIPFYGYVASIIAADSSRETDFRTLLSGSSFSSADIPHFCHLLDEVSCLSETKLKRLLLKQFIGTDEVTPSHFNVNALDIPQIIARHPVPGDAMTSGARMPRWSGRTDSNSYLKPRPLAANRFPRLTPTPEGFDRIQIEGLSPEDALTLISQRRFAEAASIASDALDQDPVDVNMLRIRIIAFAKMNKITDAIIDCSTALDLAPTIELRKARGELWKEIGVTKYAEEDRKGEQV